MSEPELIPLTNKKAATAAGALLLLTFVIPVGLTPDGTPLWSWDILGTLDTEAKVVLAGAWAIGLLAVVFSGALRGLAAGISFLVLGVAAAILYFGVAQYQLPLKLESGVVDWISAATFRTVGLIALGAFLVVAAMRSRLGGEIAVCLVQIVASAAAVALCGLLVYEGIQVAREIAEDAPMAQWWDTLFPVVAYGLVGLAAILAFFHGFAFGSPHRQLTGAASVAAWLGLLAIVVYGLVAPMVQGVVAHALDNVLVDRFLADGQMLLRVVCGLVLLLEGVAGTVSGIGALIAGPPSAGVTVLAGTSSQRLKELDLMRVRGLVTTEEYAAQRERILRDI